jgi:hypothetical protein
MTFYVLAVPKVRSTEGMPRKVLRFVLRGRGRLSLRLAVMAELEAEVARVGSVLRDEIRSNEAHVQWSLPLDSAKQHPPKILEQSRCGIMSGR